MNQICLVDQNQYLAKELQERNLFHRGPIGPATSLAKMSRAQVLACHLKDQKCPRDPNRYRATERQYPNRVSQDGTGLVINPARMSPVLIL